MPDVIVGHIASSDFARVADEFGRWNPTCTLDRGVVEGEGEIACDTLRYLWLESGAGECFIPAGQRTQEGDGRPLDAVYIPDPCPTGVMEALATLEACSESFAHALQGPVQAIVERRRGAHFIGDVAGEIWLLLESGVPRGEWTSSEGAHAALDVVLGTYRQIGWSEKSVGSWEPVMAGDQLAVTADAPLRVRGSFRYWSIDVADRTETHTSAARRLNHLRDTAGGCNFAFDAFRRLPLTWIAAEGGGDGVNAVNSHVVNIATETSRTHYHPVEPVGGGKPQSEMYLVLDPSAYGLKTYGRTASLVTFPDVEDLCRYEQTPLTPGSTVYIQPGTGHRGLDAFVNVITLPGFKPRNEIYLDQRVKDSAGGKAPHNEELTV
ncbi:hypothetical protein HN371_19305 [Candidatus Poribacteria bacterium]|nr:hypothetical protein [Candidatus Poribacteria bacterium]MBT5534406.1 hypothetical protein [Candidatus Poribacteria bacterium]MBT5712756.1 hypothetical protein [Candidatus Poribacteria bacterium]MBT7804335.1 hypothetical protein [Candidatus Poribacteria bacterium]